MPGSNGMNQTLFRTRRALSLRSYSANETSGTNTSDFSFSLVSYARTPK
jgi:hypothetical protein